jgi:hypothetical protein
MKYAIWLALGLIAGFLLGGIAPRREAAELRARVGTLEKNLAKLERARPKVRYVPLPGFDALQESIPPGRGAGSIAGRREAPGTETGDGEQVFDDRRRGRRSWWRRGAGAGAAESSEDRMARFNAAVDAQRLRASQSRAALREQARLGDADLAKLDAVIAKMNFALAKHADQLLALTQSEQEPKALETLWLGQEITGILYDSQAELETVVGAENLEKVDESSRQVWNYVDLESFRAAAEKLGEAERRRRSAR